MGIHIGHSMLQGLCRDAGQAAEAGEASEGFQAQPGPFDISLRAPPRWFGDA